MPGKELANNFLKPRFMPQPLASFALLLALIMTIYHAVILDGYPDSAKLFGVGLSALALVIGHFIMPKHFSIGFLLSCLLFVTNWRIAAMMDIWPIMWVSAACAVIYLLMFFDCMRNDWSHDQSTGWFGSLEWQMTAVRIYFGFDMVGHFTEKLFAGSASFHHMSEIFGGLGISTPGPFVIVGGLCELAIAIGIGAGLLTRLAAVGGTLYFMIANQYGAHFDNGFTWANPPFGGWEYPLLMAVFYFSFALSGAGRFSIDGWLISRGVMPRALIKLCISRVQTASPSFTAQPSR